MYPTIEPGDIIIYKPIRDKSSISLVKNGDIVIAINPKDEETLIIKRVHKILSMGLVLKGDNKLHSTDSRQFGSISFNNIKGIVEGIVPYKSK